MVEPYHLTDGWKRSFNSPLNPIPRNTLIVPFLVATDELKTPIIGYIVIEEVVKDRETKGSSSIVDVMNTGSVCYCVG